MENFREVNHPGPGKIKKKQFLRLFSLNFSKGIVGFL